MGLKFTCGGQITETEGRGKIEGQSRSRDTLSPSSTSLALTSGLFYIGDHSIGFLSPFIDKKPRNGAFISLPKSVLVRGGADPQV